MNTRWHDLIDNYQGAHDEADAWQRSSGTRREPPEKYLGDEPGRTAWSRHIYLDGQPRRDDHSAQPRPQADARGLAVGSLCYARLDPAGGASQIVALFPVCISRELHSVAPSSLLDESLRPATRREALSPADRVFGWVNAEGHGAEPAFWAGYQPLMTSSPGME